MWLCFSVLCFCSARVLSCKDNHFYFIHLFIRNLLYFLLKRTCTA